MRFFRLSDENPLTGWHMLAIVFAFFGTIIAVNMVLAFAATGTFPGLVVENSYVASQHYDELLEKAREQDAAGWSYALSVEGGIIRAHLSRHGAPLADLSVTAHVGRPSTTAEDRLFDLSPSPDRSYLASDALAPGLWEIDLQATRGSDILFRHTQEVFVKPAEAKQ